jgi:hypothetical protein
MKKIEKIGLTTIKHNCNDNSNIINLLFESGKLDELQFGDENNVTIIGFNDIENALNSVGIKIVKNEERNHSFYLNEVEEKRLEKWQKKIKKKHGKYGSYTFKFTPTGIGNGISVYSYLEDKEKDITDYDSW